MDTGTWISSVKQKMLVLSESISDLKPLDQLESLCMDSTKTLYDYIKEEEKLFGMFDTNKALQKLHIKNMSAEQIWQQIEIQNKFLISDLNNDTPLSDSNLCVQVAKLSNEVRAEVEKLSEKDDTSDDEGVEMGEEEEFSEVEEDHQSDSVVEDDKEDDDEKEEDEDDDKEDEDDLSDLDKDTFGDIVLGEDDYDSEEDEYLDSETDDFEKEREKTRAMRMRKFKSTPADSQFFSVRESEFVADNDLLSKGVQDKDDYLDLMDSMDNEQGDDEARDAMYDKFFDPAEDTSTHQEEDDEETAEFPEEGTEMTEASKFEDSLKQGEKFLKKLEDGYIEEKPWIMKGEVEKKHRPENSTLEEDLDYAVVIRQKPIITEETSEKIEKLLLTRIRSQAWDDVERRIKPHVDPFNLKRKIILDQEKSKKSLSAIYEQEFLKKQEDGKSGSGAGSSILAGPEDKSEELAAHKEIRKEMEDLFMKLDALSNYHYTPKFKDAEVKVVSNLPTITIEESTPMIASDATLLAPQEIVAPSRGELKGETEKTSTDKKSQRRSKKLHQKAKSKRESDKLNHQLKQRGKDGLMQAEASVKFVQKAVKKGQLKMLESTDKKGKKSSTDFFNELQSISSQKRKRKDSDNRKSKKGKEMTMAQLLL